MTTRAIVAVSLLGLVACNGGTPPAASQPGAVTDDAALFARIDAVPACDAPHDPRALVVAVNELQALGHDRAVGVLERYAEARKTQTSPCGGAFLVVRTLFDVPEPPGHLPPMMVGAPQPAAPADPRTAPRFPVALVDDIPFQLVEGYALGGKPEAFAHHLAAVVAVSKVRATPLAPPADARATVERIAGSPGTAFLKDHGLDDERGRNRIVEQGQRFTDTAPGR